MILALENMLNKKSVMGELQQQVPDQVILGRGLSQKVQTFLSYANYVITSITEENFFVKKS